jgi:hypothetical protein
MANFKTNKETTFLLGTLEISWRGVKKKQVFLNVTHYRLFPSACLSGFGGLVVSALASGTHVRGFKPGRSRRIFRAKKSSARFPLEGK